MRTSHFLSSTSGAVTVDWVVLTAALVGLGLATMAVVSGGVNDVSNDIDDGLHRNLIQTAFYKAGVLAGYGQPGEPRSALNLRQGVWPDDADDFTGAYTVAYDDHGMTFEFTVTDDVIIQDDSPHAWKDDGVEIFLHAAGSDNPLYAANPVKIAAALGDNRIIFSNPGTSWAELPIPSGMSSSSVATDDGYQMTVSVSWEDLGYNSPPPAGAEMGLAVTFTDDDEGNGAISQSFMVDVESPEHSHGLHLDPSTHDTLTLTR